MEEKETRMEEQRDPVCHGADVMIMTMSCEGVLHSLNKTAQNLLGCKDEDVIGKCKLEEFFDAREIRRRAHFLSRRLGCEVPEGNEVFFALVKLQGEDCYEWTCVARNGQRFPIRLTITVLRSDNGGIQGYLGVATDLTIWKISEERLYLSEELFRNAFDNAPIGQALVSPDGRWLRVNYAVCRLLGCTKEELYRTSFQDITHPEDLNEDLNLMHEVLDRKRTGYQIEKRYRHVRGHYVWALLNVSLIRNDDGTPRYFLSQIQDISEQKRAQDEMQAALRRADEANAAKSIFVANVSHETRTPLQGLMGVLDLLEDTPLNEEQREMLHTLRLSAESLLHLLNDLVDLSKMEAGKLNLEETPFRPADLVLHGVKMFTARSVEKRIVLRALISEDDRSLVLRGDSMRLQQVVFNLLSNALKFTDEGEVVIRMASAEGENDRHRLLIEVEDTGIGIPPEARRHLFQPFSQLDPSMSRRHGGAGLGLKISRHIVELMGGSIVYHARAGGGSIFSVRVELPRVEQEESQIQVFEPIVPVRFENCRILLAEDNPVSQKLLVRMLEGGCEVVQGFPGLQGGFWN